MYEIENTIHAYIEIILMFLMKYVEMTSMRQILFIAQMHQKSPPDPDIVC